VQGVFFRKHTREKAIELGITGSVRNCKDGTVEIFAEGTVEQIKTFIQWCRTGPEKAKVDLLDIHEQPLKNFPAFIIIY
jgi:acylphosphatase